jgi:hypothetical protein
MQANKTAPKYGNTWIRKYINTQDKNVNIRFKYKPHRRMNQIPKMLTMPRGLRIPIVPTTYQVGSLARESLYDGLSKSIYTQTRMNQYIKQKIIRIIGRFFTTKASFDWFWLLVSVVCDTNYLILDYRLADQANAQWSALCPFGVLVGGTRRRRFEGTSFKPCNLWRGYLMSSAIDFTPTLFAC